jgi:membrane protein YqaA with SNARE-associated domain
MTDDLSLWGLFLSAFISSTLFPGGSEVVLGVLAANQTHAPALLLTVASVGNTLGALTTWFLGWLVARGLPPEKYLTDSRRRALEQVRRFGSPVLLLSWLPVVGDPLCFAAGYLRLPFLASLLFIAFGKTARYAAILWVFG